MEQHGLSWGEIALYALGLSVTVVGAFWFFILRKKKPKSAPEIHDFDVQEGTLVTTATDDRVYRRRLEGHVKLKIEENKLVNVIDRMYDLYKYWQQVGCARVGEAQWIPVHNIREMHLEDVKSLILRVNMDIDELVETIRTDAKKEEQGESKP